MPGIASRRCSCPTGPRTTTATARRPPTSRTRRPSRRNSASRCTRQASRPSTARACSSSSSPSWRRAARRTPTCSATARSSSASASTMRGAWAPIASRPDITHVSIAAACCAASTRERTRATSCMPSMPRSSPSPSSRWVTFASPKSGASPAIAACRSPPSATRPASASSASGRSASSSAGGCAAGRGRSRTSTARSSGGIAGSSDTRSASAAASGSAAAKAAAPRPGSRPRRTSGATCSSSSRAPDTRACTARA